MGTPDFAVASLKALVEAEYNVVAAITAPDKPAGRGMKMQESAVKQYAVQQGIPVLQPEKLKTTTFLETLANYKADLQIVVAFRMLPEQVWNMPPLGTINVHGSLLPQYRGAAPINWAIINGELETGVTTFKLQHQIDTGNILMQAKLPITEQDNAGTIHDAMKELGAKVLIQTVDGLLEHTLTEKPQHEIIDESLIKHAPKIFTDTCKIDFHQPTKTIFNLIRGLAPYPGAFTYLQDKIFKLFDVSYTIEPHQQIPGSLSTDGKKLLKIATADGFIVCHSVQLEGKKRMQVEEFLKGNTKLMQ
jgi:methionyl-tRNA formyltransferase